jgi:hypothetical protein
MNIERQAEIFKAFVKKVIKEREKVSLDHIITMEEVKSIVKEFNAQNKMSTPLTVAEFYELYSVVMTELMAEYMDALNQTVSEVRDQAPGT